MSEHTKETFKREPRYVVFKIGDLLRFAGDDIGTLDRIGNQIASGRNAEGRAQFNAVVVEQDWPEFDLVWAMIEARMTGKGVDASRVTACVNACAGITTGNLEDGPTLINILRERNEKLLAALKDCMEHMEYSTSYGRQAWDKAQQIIAEVEAR